MRPVGISYDTRGVEGLKPAALKAAISRALRKAGQTALRDMRAEASRRVRARKRIKGKAIRDALVLRRPRQVTMDGAEWAVDVRGKPVSLTSYPHRQTERVSRWRSTGQADAHPLGLRGHHAERPQGRLPALGQGAPPHTRAARLASGRRPPPRGRGRWRVRARRALVRRHLRARAAARALQATEWERTMSLRDKIRRDSNQDAADKDKGPADRSEETAPPGKARAAATVDHVALHRRAAEVITYIWGAEPPFKDLQDLLDDLRAAAEVPGRRSLPTSDAD